MSLQDQLDAVLALQGDAPAEDNLLQSELARYEDHGGGTNETNYVVLGSDTEAFHKPFSGVDEYAAQDYGHEADEVPLNECAAWRLATALGSPLDGLVAVCVLRSFHGEAGSLSLRVHGEDNAGDEPMLVAPDQVAAAAFFDSLIAQQDRHAGNFLWDHENEALGLIDHGFAFAVGGDYCNAAYLVDWRNDEGPDGLAEWERDALARLVGSTNLLGLGRILSPDRASALRERAERMLDGGAILPRGGF